MFTKKVRIFGRSVPVALILALVVVMGVAAAWLFAQEQTADISSAAGVNVEYYGTSTCSITANPVGDAVATASGLNGCIITNARPNVEFQIVSSVHNIGTYDVCHQASLDESGLPAYASVTSWLTDGPDMVPDGYRQLTVNFALDDTLPSDLSNDPLTVSLVWDAESCP